MRRMATLEMLTGPVKNIMLGITGLAITSIKSQRQLLMNLMTSLLDIRGGMMVKCGMRDSMMHLRTHGSVLKRTLGEAADDRRTSGEQVMVNAAKRRGNDIRVPPGGSKD